LEPPSGSKGNKSAPGKEEIKAWILGFGPKARVIAPKALRNEIEADLL
jgi:predicted DNA-binding transcriptional regulator YafY